MKKYAKTIFFGVIILLAVIGYSRYFLCDMPPPPEPEIIVDLWSKPLIDSGYKPVTGNKPDATGLPDKVRPIMTAEGTYKDSLSVEITVVETPDDVVWVKAVIDGEQVKFRTVQYYQQTIASGSSDWSLILASEWINSPDLGIGIAWEPLKFKGARAGLQAVFDINRDILTGPDWITPAVRISRRFGAVSIGGYAGFRFGEQQGLGMGVSLGVAIGI